MTICIKDMMCVLGTVREASSSENADQIPFTQAAASHVGRDALIPPPIRFDVPVSDAMIPYELVLTDIGIITDRHIRGINESYGCIAVDKYIIMPNHIHLLIMIDGQNDEGGGMRASRPTLQVVVRSIKTLVTREIGRGIWQPSFYERIVRNEREYQEIWRYIDDNPRRWVESEKRTTDAGLR